MGAQVPRTSHPELVRLAQLLPSVLLNSRKQSTLAQYASPWNRWAAFAARTGVSALPASPAHLALYLVSLLQTAATPSPLENACAAIFAYHDLTSQKSPTGSGLVKTVLEAAKRMLPSGVNKKEPLTLEDVVRICGATRVGYSLSTLMICAAISLSFAGFLRFSDLANVRLEFITLGPDNLEIFLESRKSDRYREGHWIRVASWPDQPLACPVTLVRRLIAAGNLAGNRPLFSAVAGGTYGTAPLSYTTARTLMLERFEAAGLDKAAFGTHSCRAGGATLAANLGVHDRLWMEHGGWKSVDAARGYIKTSASAKLSVTQAMFAGAAPSSGLPPPLARPAPEARRPTMPGAHAAPPLPAAPQPPRGRKRAQGLRAERPKTRSQPSPPPPPPPPTFSRRGRAIKAPAKP